ncbi:MAG: VRR-NUC domain-containing protein [Verrucomicrobiae bacterium]|nr:VRR-NUC domain-containing protein [Verrucomicrobiae bacterium]
MLERTLEALLSTLVRQAGGVSYKLDARAAKGAPDRVVVMPGRAPVFVELKAPYGRVSPMQFAALDRLRRAGADVRVLRGKDAVESFIREMTS